MTYKFLLTAFLTSLSSISVLASTAVAQERPKCYLIDSSGELSDLTDICDVSLKRSPKTAPVTNEKSSTVNNSTNSESAIKQQEADSNRYLERDAFSIESAQSGIDSSYYIDNEIGSDYTAYVRRYRKSPTSFIRSTVREQAFQLDTVDRSPTSILRSDRSELPFIIYRYQN